MAKHNSVFKRGDIVYASLGNYPGSSRQSGDRPCIVVSSTKNNIVSPVMTVCPITTRIRNNPIHIRITPDDVQGYLQKESDIMVEQITVIDKKSIISKYGYAKPEFMEQVNEVLRRHLTLMIPDDKAGDQA